MRVLLMVILVLIFSSCVRNKNGMTVEKAEVPINTKNFEVTEVIQTSKYTYLKVKENVAERWVAVARQEAGVGEVYYYEGALQMTNFQSKELNRTFEEIFFINRISKTPISQSNAGAMPAHSGKVSVQESSKISMKKAENEITVAQIFANRNDYSGKEVEIRGVVVKVNNKVMGKNWIHVQDGTSDNGSFDLTVTTQDFAEIGQEVNFKGKITLGKNFGSGYFYDIILEDAVLINSNSVAKTK